MFCYNIGMEKFNKQQITPKFTKELTSKEPKYKITAKNTLEETPLIKNFGTNSFIQEPTIENITEYPIQNTLFDNSYIKQSIQSETVKDLKPLQEQTIKSIYQEHIFTQPTEEAVVYQQSILVEPDLAPELIDYAAAYKKLNADRNRGWKLNPSDIADFYLLEPFLQRTGTKDAYHEDTTNMAVLKAKDRVSIIGKRLLVALAHEQLDEYDRFATVNPKRMPDALKEKVEQYYDETRPEGMRPKKEESLTFRMNYYLSAFKAKLDQHATRQQALEVFDDTDMFATAVQILETQQSGRWKVMATAMQALMNTSYPVGEFLSAALPSGATTEVQQELQEHVEANRETFLIDRLINYVHNTGMMSARVTNYFPRAASLLLAHGLPQHEQYLFYHSSFNYSYDTLATHLRKDLPSDGDRDLLGDLTTAVNEGNLPREYEYGMLLEFGGTELEDTIQEKRASENPTPGRVYNLLQRISHHDGTSKGRLKHAA